MAMFNSYVKLPEGIWNYGYNYLGKFHHDLTVLLHWNHAFFLREIIPMFGPTIQVSELL